MCLNCILFVFYCRHAVCCLIGMVGCRRRSCIAQWLALISACITCSMVLQYLLVADSIDYDSSSDIAAETHRHFTKTIQNSTISTAQGNWYDALLDNPDCPWDALGAPEQVRVAGCDNGECDLITCRRLLKNDSDAMLAAKNFVRRHRRQLLLSDDEVMLMASNCTEFRRRGGYMDKPLRESDADFPIAFNILIHWQLQQFERLLRAIYRPQNTYCIHIDAKTSYSFHATVLAIARCFDNVFVASKRYHIVYEGFSRLQVRFPLIQSVKHF
jgi:Core-2/I-Branching enzyme